MTEDFPACLLPHEPIIRIAALLGMFGIMIAWESLAPRRAGGRRRGRRTANLVIMALDAALLRLAVPAATVGLAMLAQERGWGLLNLLALPTPLAMLASLLLLDLALYIQHRLAHGVPALWRLHRLHHTDLEMDVTTGVRFHPFEMALSLLYKGSVVLALGAAPVAVLAYEVLLNSSSLFNHSNARLPAALDRILRTVWATPDVHRVHHSSVRRETDSNFGSCLTLWDRLFGTFVPQPQAGHDDMDIGLEEFRAPTEQSLWGLLLNPLRNAPGARAAPTEQSSPARQS